MKEHKVLIAVPALDMMPVLSADSKIAYESSNHYFYLPCDLGEAYVSVLYALRWLATN